MSEKAFEIIVSNLRAGNNPQVAIADAMKQLVQGDHTETIGMGAHILDVEILGETPTEDFAVAFELVVPIADDDHLKRLMDNLSMINSVETVEEISVV